MRPQNSIRAVPLLAVAVLTVVRPSHGQQIWYVRADAKAANAGTSWEDAFSDLHDALAVAGAGDEIWVAAGTYKPDRGTGDRSLSYRLVSGVALYGGFAGWEAKRDQRDWVKNETILSGDLNGDDGPRDCAEHSNCCVEHESPGCDDPECEALICAADPDCCDPKTSTRLWDFLCVVAAKSACCHLGSRNACENSIAVVIAENTDESIVLDGLTITRNYGNSIRDGLDIVAGGLVVAGASVAISHCTFSHDANWGIFVDRGSEIQVTECTFTKNAGAGIWSIGRDANVAVRDCEFTDNDALGMSNDGTTTVARSLFLRNGWSRALDTRGYAEITDSVFIDNRGRALRLGGLGARASVSNCRFLRNAGGGVNISGGRATLRDCEIIGNSNTALNGPGVVTISNCLIAGNRTGHATVSFGFGTVTLDNCTIARNRTGSTLAAAFELSTEAVGRLTNCIIWGNQGGRTDTPTIRISDDSSLEINHSLIQGWDGSLGGVGNFGADPLFVPGPAGDYYLSQTAAGQGVNSPAVEAGSDTAVNLGLDTMTTRSDEGSDIGIVDIGYHFPITGGKLILGDFDRNGLIDLFDVSGFQNCFTGQGPTDVPPSCRIFDFVPDSSIDLTDFAAFQLTLTGP